jgi:site-specific DNA recombinase
MCSSLSVALYARVSSQRQAEELTIHSQVAALRERIAVDAHSIADELCFLDEGYSGSTLFRPALERLRDLAHVGGLDQLYVHSPDRLARKYVYQMLLLEEFSRHGVQVVFLNQDPQDESAEGNLLLQMQGMIAEYERAKILERTRRGRRFAARQGKVSVLPTAPYGYRYVPKHLADGEARYDVVLEEARLVREIFAWVGVEGLSLRQVTDRLRERGIPTAKGRPRWDGATIRGILHNTAYIGMAKYGKTRLVPRTPGRRPKRGDPAIPRLEKVSRPTAPEEQESIPVPAIVSAELFGAVAERLEQNRRRYRQHRQGTRYLLSGLLVCQRCGSAYCARKLGAPKKDGSHYFYYRCLGGDRYRHGGETICANKGLSGAVLETAVWADVCSLLQDPERVRREFQRRLDRPATEPPDAAHYKDSIAKLKRRLARLVDAYENGWLEKEDFQSRIGRVQERLAREEEAYAEYERNVTSDDELRLVIGQFQTFAQQIVSGLEGADFDLRRKLLRLLVNRIEVRENEIQIVYKVQPPPFVLRPARGDFLQDCLKRTFGPPGLPFPSASRFQAQAARVCCALRIDAESSGDRAPTVGGCGERLGGGLLAFDRRADRVVQGRHVFGVAGNPRRFEPLRLRKRTNDHFSISFGGSGRNLRLDPTPRLR